MAQVRITNELIDRMRHLRFVEKKPLVAIAWELGVPMARIRKLTGRKARERTPRIPPTVSPLTDEQAREMRLAYARMGLQPLSLRFHVSQATVRDILTGELNKNAGGPIYTDLMVMRRRRQRMTQRTTPTGPRAGSFRASPKRHGRTVEDYDAYARPTE